MDGMDGMDGWVEWGARKGKRKWKGGKAKAKQACILPTGVLERNGGSLFLFLFFERVDVGGGGD